VAGALLERLDERLELSERPHQNGVDGLVVPLEPGEGTLSPSRRSSS